MISVDVPVRTVLAPFGGSICLYPRALFVRLSGLVSFLLANCGHLSFYYVDYVNENTKEGRDIRLR